MTAIAAHYDVLVRGDTLAGAFQRAEREVAPAARARVRLWTQWGEVARRKTGSVFIVSGLRDLTSEPELSRARRLTVPSKRFLLFVDREGIPAESIAESVLELGVRSSQRLHLARLDVDTEVSYLSRFVAGLLASDHDGVIMDAWWDRDELVVISPTFQRLRIPAASLPRLRSASPADRASFEIDPHGDFLYWPSHDIHMGWAQFQQAVDPRARLRAEQKDARFNARYGRAVRVLRESKGLSQQSIAGLDERTVRRIEQGKTRATANALTKLAKAHRMTPADYMTAVADLLDKEPKT